VGGVPAKIIRYRVPEETIPDLLKTAWWDKDIHWLKTHCDEFRDVHQFLQARRLQTP
jgi:hypothetical protein